MSEPVGWMRAVVYDAEDIETLASFWGAVLGVEIASQEEGWLRLDPDRGGAYVAFEPIGLGSSQSERASFVRGRPDIEVEDMDVAQARIEELGGKLLAILRPKPGDSHRRMADPEGNEFTIVLPHAAASEPS